MEFGIRAIEYTIFGHKIVISETNIVTWLIILALVIFALIVRASLANFKEVPESGFQNFIEVFVDFFDGLTESTMGKDKMGFSPYFLTIFTFMVIANLIGLLGLRPPTADLNTTFAFGLATFFMIHISGISRKGLGYFKGFLEPMPFLLPLNIIGELATPVSLSFRLFGNILGGLIIMGLYYGMLPIIATLGIPAVLHIYFDVFSGVLQSFIFTMLSMTFIASAMD